VGLLLVSVIVWALLSGHPPWFGGPQPTPPPPYTTTQKPTTQEPTTQEPTLPTQTPPEPAPVPPSFVLDQSCNTGTGQTGLTIYYKLPPNDSFRYVCYYKASKSPVLDYRDSAFLQHLADTGGPYCAFSNVDKNVGCALSPITEKDLMNAPPPPDEEPTTQKPTTMDVKPKSSPTGSTTPDGYSCPSGYPIKGNVSQNNSEKIYHEPGWRYYDATKPEQCFATESDAESEGYRASKVR
jgi:hypothetical protein